MIGDVVARRAPHVLLASLCVGIAAANAGRGGWPLVALAGVGACCGLAGSGSSRVVLLGLALCLAGWWWGSLRLAALDRSPLAAELGRAGRVVAAITAPPRRARFSLRVPADVRMFADRRLHEPVLLKLPLGRAPPQGTVIELVAQVVAPKTAADGFDERTYLRRHGIHVVLRGGPWRALGKRSGLGGVADRLHAAVDRSLRDGSSGERGALLLGVVLGDDGEIDETLRERFRASGLYHLLRLDKRGITL